MTEKKAFLPLGNLKETKSIINDISIFGGLNDPQLERLFKYLKKVTYAAEEMIYKQGDEPKYIYVVKKGEVVIMMDQEGSCLELIRFRPGDCFGETSVIGLMPHSANAVAVEETELIVLERATFLSIFEIDKDIFGLLILNIARESCRRLHMTDEILLHYVMKKKTG